MIDIDKLDLGSICCIELESGFKPMFLCTSVKLEKSHTESDNNKHMYVRYDGYIDSNPNSYPNELNKFSIRDLGINIYYSSIDSFLRSNKKVNTIAHIKKDLNDGSLKYDNGDYDNMKDISFIAKLTLHELHQFYKLKDRCAYYDFHFKKTEDESNIITGSIYKIIDNSNLNKAFKDIKYIIPIRKTALENKNSETIQDIGMYFMTVLKDGFTSSIKIPLYMINKFIYDGCVKYIGFVKPDLFQLYFDMFHAYGNPVIKDINSIIMKVS